MKVYLIAHANNADGQGAAQASIQAKSEASARKKFEQRYPERVVLTVGVKGG